MDQAPDQQKPQDVSPQAKIPDRPPPAMPNAEVARAPGGSQIDSATIQNTARREKTDAATDRAALRSSADDTLREQNDGQKGEAPQQQYPDFSALRGNGGHRGAHHGWNEGRHNRQTATEGHSKFDQFREEVKASNLQQVGKADTKTQEQKPDVAPKPDLLLQRSETQPQLDRSAKTAEKSERSQVHKEPSDRDRDPHERVAANGANTIAFPWDSAKIHDSSLTPFLASQRPDELLAVKDGKKYIEIRAGASREGDAAYNQVLSDQRAEAARATVARLLDVNPATIDAKGIGEQNAAKAGQEDGHDDPNDRVATITIKDKPVVPEPDLAERDIPGIADLAKIAADGVPAGPERKSLWEEAYQAGKEMKQSADHFKLVGGLPVVGDALKYALGFSAHLAEKSIQDISAADGKWGVNAAYIPSYVREMVKCAGGEFKLFEQRKDGNISHFDFRVEQGKQDAIDTWMTMSSDQMDSIRRQVRSQSGARGFAKALEASLRDRIQSTDRAFDGNKWHP